MVEKKIRPIRALELALELASEREHGVVRLVLALYSEHTARLDDPQRSREGYFEPEDYIKSQLIAILANDKSREIIFKDLLTKLIERIEAAHKEKRDVRREAIIAAFGYYCFLADWIENVAEDSDVELTSTERGLITALQVIFKNL